MFLNNRAETRKSGPDESSEMPKWQSGRCAHAVRREAEKDGDDGRESGQAGNYPGNDRDARRSGGGDAQSSMKLVFIDGHGWHPETAI
jgi:hypothetical protein